MQISKSDYMLYLRQPAWLWLKKNEKETLPPIDDNLHAIFNTGFLFETYAEQLFPGATRLGFSDYKEYISLPKRTQDALRNGSKTIFQGRFEYDDYTFICDVINVVDGKLVDLYEIKSSTSAKLEHEYDLAFQSMVLESCGYQVRNMYVIHVNNEFVKQGEINPKDITTITDLTDNVKSKKELTEQNAELAAATARKTIIPDPSPALANLGSYKEWLGIYRRHTVVPKYSIYDVAKLSQTQALQLEKDGVRLMTDIPANFVLTGKQSLQIQSTARDVPIVNKDSIAEYIDELEFPLYFLDYETYSGLVPYFDGQKPYQQIPFQYSLHILDNPTAELRQEDYLHSENSNPVSSLSAALKSHIGDKGSVITWNMGFEKSCNTRMGQLASDYEAFYAKLNQRVVDLMIPFSRGWYVDKDFLGSASIKKVLPVLVPELSYSDLEIHEGGSAQRLWMETVLDEKRASEKARILANLKEYCQLDTLAMVKIYQVLRDDCV